MMLRQKAAAINVISKPHYLRRLQHFQVVQKRASGWLIQMRAMRIWNYDPSKDLTASTSAPGRYEKLCPTQILDSLRLLFNELCEPLYIRRY
jgi:hypothetical protein